jgi:hypothetical protein
MEKELKQRAANVLSDHSLLLLNALSMNEVNAWTTKPTNYGCFLRDLCS